ncbi:HAUS augmin-like complex subunit 2 [Crassostrea virginica]|uniref:HAUS augmin-like complex subunit 2 n=1 Tax=Crassostrea virginica TaxID=6565 RepID=A0A8B8CU12_CRAVI|nr:HAUS augmin-like complex subunit 2 [Crassostrea virginica]XP_022319342.1 HAUS augmin-like complex subunit 2 [Crassostrea virginica]
MDLSSLSKAGELNPWSDADSALSPLLNVLSLVEKLGYIDKSKHEKVKSSAPSLALITMLKETTRIQKELHQVDLDIQRRMQDKETKDITHIAVREKRVKDIQSLNGHMQSIIDSKSQLKTRLQQPFVGDFVKIEAQYHRYAADLFPQISPILADLNTHLENITWVKSLSFKDGKMDGLLSELNNTLAGLQTTFQLLCQMRNNMTQFHNLDLKS